MTRPWILLDSSAKLDTICKNLTNGSLGTARLRLGNVQRPRRCFAAARIRRNLDRVAPEAEPAEPEDEVKIVG